MQVFDTGVEPDEESTSGGGRGKHGSRGGRGRGRARGDNGRAAQPGEVLRGRGQAGVPALVPEEGTEQRQVAHDEQMQVIIHT